MDIVTLQQVKDQCGETTSARDAYLTQVAEGIETEIFAYLRASTKEAITATCPPELSAQADAILEHAVLRWINPRIKDSSCDIFKDGKLRNALLPYRLPAVAASDEDA